MTDPESEPSRVQSCACPSLDAYSCIRARYPKPFICDDASDDLDPEPCECACHAEWEDESYEDYP
jgi:hypothetical protein